MSDAAVAAKLAKILFAPEELVVMERALNEELSKLDVFRALELTEACAAAEPVRLDDLRDDQVAPSTPAELLLAAAPAKCGAFFAIPKVVD